MTSELSYDYGNHEEEPMAHEGYRNAMDTDHFTAKRVQMAYVIVNRKTQEVVQNRYRGQPITRKPLAITLVLEHEMRFLTSKEKQE